MSRKDEGYWPNLDDQPNGDPDIKKWVPPSLYETGLAPVPEEHAQFPWPKGYAPVITRKMAR